MISCRVCDFFPVKFRKFAKTVVFLGMFTDEIETLLKRIWQNSGKKVYVFLFHVAQMDISRTQPAHQH